MSEAAKLLAWYDARRRELPWRETRDPYRVWISEVMLQQTQVKTVIPYYQAFVRRFPTVEELGLAAVDEVLARWSGLGYYRRARQLHRAAREMVAAGRFPATARELERYPGIGPYTAAAVASIAFGEAVPVLDGNVERLLSRRLATAADPKRCAARQKLLAAAAALLDPERPGHSNQALMELGATVCRPLKPDCPSCVLATGCRARRRGDPERYPAPRRRRRVERRELAVAVARDRARVLLFRRPQDSELLSGMWELPNVPRGSTTGEIEEALAQRYGGRWRLAAAGATVRHGITYRAFEIHVYRARFEAGDCVSEDSVAEGPEAAWVGPEERPRFPASSMVEKVLKVL